MFYLEGVVCWGKRKEVIETDPGLLAVTKLSRISHSLFNNTKSFDVLGLSPNPNARMYLEAMIKILIVVASLANNLVDLVKFDISNKLVRLEPYDSSPLPSSPHIDLSNKKAQIIHTAPFKVFNDHTDPIDNSHNAFTALGVLSPLPNLNTVNSGNNRFSGL